VVFCAMPVVLRDLAELPVGSHALGLYSERTEAADQAVQFVAGAPPEMAATFWVPTPEIAKKYNDRLAAVAPERVGCVAVLDHEQVAPVEGKLRPIPTVTAFLSQHPDGVTAGGDTLSRYWDSKSMSEHLEYEAWFDQQPRVHSRFLCPYDLRTVRPDHASDVLRDLGRHHSHVVLSSSSEPAVRLLQLFIFGSSAELPERMRGDHRWAVEQAYVEPTEATAVLELTPTGRELVQAWGDRTVVDW
jgi:hypothetical protein